MNKLILFFFLFLTSFFFSQTIEEKVNYTYDNFSSENYSNSVKYIDEIEKHLFVEQVSSGQIINFYDLTIHSYYNLSDYKTAIAFGEKRREFVESLQRVPIVDSLILDSYILLYTLSREISNTNESSRYIDKIIELSKDKNGFYLDAYNLFSLGKVDIIIQKNNYVDAIELLKELESYNLYFYNSNSFELVDLYIKLGLSYMEISNIELSKNYLMKSLEILKDFNKEFSMSGIQATLCLGSLYRIIGDYKSAIDYFERAEKYGGDAFSAEPLLLCTFLQNKAMLLREFEDFEKFHEVEELYWQNIKIRKEVLGESHSEYASALISLGRFYQTVGNYLSAETYIRKGQEILLNSYGSNFNGVAYAISELSQLKFELDDFKEALLLSKDALSIYESNNFVNTLEFAQIKSRLAYFYWSMRDYKNAILEFENSIELYIALFSEEHRFVIQEKLALAHLYSEIGNITKAKEIVTPIASIDESAVNYAFENYFDGNYCLIELNHQQELSKAVYEDELRLLKKIEKSDFKGTDRHASLLKKLAMSEFHEGNIESALKRLRKINSINIDQYGSGHTKVAESFHLISQAYFTLGRLDSAEFYLKKAYTIKVNVYGANNPNTSDVLKDLAYLEMKKGNAEKGDILFRDFIKIEEDNFLKTYLVLNETGMLEYKDNIENSTRRYFDLRIPKNDSINSGTIIELYESWQSCNGINYSFNLRLKNLVESSNDSTVTNTYHAIKNEMAKRTKWIGFSVESRKNLKCNIDSLDIKIQSLERKLYASLDIKLSQLSPIDNDQVFSLIDSNSIYINISELNPANGNYLFSIYSSSTPQPILINSIIDLKEISGVTQNYEEENSLLYDLLWKHLESFTNGIKRIYISSEGIYSQLNLSTFYNAKANKFLFEKHEIVVFDNLRSFVAIKTRKKNESFGSASSLYGYPNYNSIEDFSPININQLVSKRDLSKIWIDSLNRGGIKVIDLPGTKVEVDQIAKTLQKNGWKVNSYIGVSASESNIKKEANPRILHIATHGYFFDDIPLDTTENRFLGLDRNRVVEDPMLRSGLLLTGANRTLQGEESQGENGLLSAAEASLLDLRETELVVLSACETGKGVVKNSEGVYGLRKAFADAGAQNVIMSLWEVDDKVTQEFMTRFYEIWLNDKTTIREAFNRTQLEIKAKYPQPYYWGAFILVGE
jgi:CHAT domain-containing protein